MDIVIAWKKSHFILSDRADLLMIDNLWIAVHIFAWCLLISLSVDEMLLPRYVNSSTYSRGLWLGIEVALFLIKTHGFCLSCIHVGANASCCLHLVMQLGFACYHHHHHVVPIALISLTLSCHFSLSFIASGRSSGLHPVSSHSCCMYVRAGCPAFARPYAAFYWSTSLMSSSLLLQQCPACLVRLTWIVFVMGGRWPYSWCYLGCCHQDLFNIARSILV